MARKSIVLGAGAAAVCLLFGVWYMLKINNEKAILREAEENAGDTIVDVGQAEIASFSFRMGEETVTFTGTENGWKLEGDEDFPVSGTEISSLLSYFEPLEAVRTLEDVEDISEYGMEDPANIFSLSDTEGNTTIITIGSNNEGTGDDYVMKDENGDVIYTISSALRNAVGDDLYDYAESEEIPAFSSDDIVRIIVKDGKESYELEKEEEEDGQWSVSGADGELDQEALETAASSLSYLSYRSYVEYDSTDDAAYGFDDGKEIAIIYKESTAASREEETQGETPEDSSGSEESEMESAEDTSTLIFKIGDRDSDGNYYSQQENSKEVHTLLASALDPFLNREFILK